MQLLSMAESTCRTTSGYSIEGDLWMSLSSACSD